MKSPKATRIVLPEFTIAFALACLATLSGCEGCEPSRDAIPSSPADQPESRDDGESAADPQAGPSEAQGNEPSGSQKTESNASDAPSSSSKGKPDPDFANGSKAPMPDGRSVAEILQDARTRREKSRAAEAQGKKSEAYQQTLSAWELVRSRNDAECRDLATELLADIERLGRSQNRSIQSSGDFNRINNVPIISR